MHVMKSLSTFLLLAILLFGGGCFPLTQKVTERAKGYTREDKKTHEVENIPANGAYYALTPVTIPADIAMTPFLLLLLGVWLAAGAPGAFGH